MDVVPPRWGYESPVGKPPCGTVLNIWFYTAIWDYRVLKHVPRPGRIGPISYIYLQTQSYRLIFINGTITSLGWVHFVPVFWLFVLTSIYLLGDLYRQRPDNSRAPGREGARDVGVCTYPWHGCHKKSSHVSFRPEGSVLGVLCALCPGTWVGLPSRAN